MPDSHDGADDLPAVRGAKERFAEQLLANPDVNGVGVGHRRRSGEKVEEYAVVVHVTRKRPLDEVDPDRRVPGTLRYAAPDGREVVVRVDVQERDKPTVEDDRPAVGVDLGGRCRPVLGGVSVSSSGTFGGWVWDTVTNQVVALSNRHVFGSVAGTPVIQPAGEDGGGPADRIASVLRAGSLDAAIAVPIDPSVVGTSIAGGGPAVFEIADAVLDMPVHKTGRRTGLTHGVVDLIDYDSDHHGSHTDLWIDGGGDDFSDGGDSGALYLEARASDRGDWHRVVGLHWGGAGNDGVGHHIRAVFEDLGLDTLPP
ncbi:hypothetical protein [Nonomuraea sp. SBT364]|uniref:hypothetical protein n=1 Tax=Nonomuraea sp. SBT364 TaxID=1580530 RepID=UPI00066BB3B8|nr:hypothetical protein [Nonomuraea sp. SBT364]